MGLSAKELEFRIGFAERLNRWRTAQVSDEYPRGWSQQRLAEEIGKSPALVNRYLTKPHLIPISFVQLVSQAIPAFRHEWKELRLIEEDALGELTDREQIVAERRQVIREAIGELRASLNTVLALLDKLDGE